MNSPRCCSQVLWVRLIKLLSTCLQNHNVEVCEERTLCKYYRAREELFFFVWQPHLNADSIIWNEHTLVLYVFFFSGLQPFLHCEINVRLIGRTSLSFMNCIMCHLNRWAGFKDRGGSHHCCLWGSLKCAYDLTALVLLIACVILHFFFSRNSSWQNTSTDKSSSLTLLLQSRAVIVLNEFLSYLKWIRCFFLLVYYNILSSETSS